MQLNKEQQTQPGFALFLFAVAAASAAAAGKVRQFSGSPRARRQAPARQSAEIVRMAGGGHAQRTKISPSGHLSQAARPPVMMDLA